MKKLLALVLALALVFTLVGCGAANSGDADKKDLKVGFINNPSVHIKQNKST